MSEKKTAQVHPYYQAILDVYAELDRPFYHQITPVAAREMLKTSLAAAPVPVGIPELAECIDEHVTGPDGDIPVRRYRPQGEVKGVCIYLHAGGWVIGDLDTGDALCRRLANLAECEVISVDYRLAPEHPYPAALNDVTAVMTAVAERSKLPLVLVGESAGANLVAAAAILSRDGRAPAIAAQFLAYPVTNSDFSTDSYREVGALNYLLSEADMRWFWDHYCPPGVDRNNPLVSPLKVESAEGLAPAMICVAELDPLRDEGLAYAKRLADSGVAVTSRCDPGMLHGYLSAAGSVDIAADAVNQAGQWLREQFEAAQ